MIATKTSPRATASSLRFNVVIVNHDGLDTLLAAVQSACREGVPTTQIAVVDNGSSDDSLPQVVHAEADVKVLRNSCNAGFARAVNQGVRALEEREFVLLLNNDAELLAGALQAFATAFDGSPRLAIAGGQLLYPNGRLQSAFAPLPTLAQEFIPVNFLKWAKPEHYVRHTGSMAMREVESVFGACLCVRTAALREIGLLDEDFFFYFEEVDWCRRASLAHWRVAYVPEARAVHLAGHTAQRYRGDARVELQRSKLLYFRKSGTRLGYWALSAFLVFRAGVNAFFGVLACLFTLGLKRHLWTNTGVYWRLFLWHVAGRPKTWGLPGKCAR